jgi:uncharacterized membrane protein
MVKGIMAVSIAMVLCFALGLVGWLSIHNVNSTPVLYFFAGSVAPLIGQLWNNVKTGRAKDTIDEVATAVEEVKHNTNGALSERINAAVKDAMNDIMKDGLKPPGEGK